MANKKYKKQPRKSKNKVHQTIKVKSKALKTIFGVKLDAAFFNPTYNDRNTELFLERDEIKAELQSLVALSETRALSREEARRKGQLSRKLDTLTGDIVQANYGLVKSYTRKFTSNTSKDDSDDFVGAAIVGLMRAVDTYQVSKGKFGTWAFKPIQREVLRAVRDADHPNMNPGDFEKRPDILKAYTRLQNGNEDASPTNAEVAKEAGTTIEQVARVLEAPRLDSISTPIGDEGDATLGDLIEDDDLDVADAVLAQMEIDSLAAYGLKNLEQRELFVLSRRYGLDGEPEQRLSAIGDILGLSREAVRQVEAKAFAKMLHPVTLRKIARHGRS